MPETTRHIGLCPVCMRRIKVRGGLLVHHGYTRPGYGEIEGDCFGVHRAPYELSDSTAVEYLDEVILPMRTRTQRDLDKLPSATRLPKMVWSAAVAPGIPGRYEPKLVTREEAGSDYEWRELYKRREGKLRSTLGFLDDEYARLMELVNDWKPAELETVQEAQVAKRAAKEERERGAVQRREAKIADMIVRYQKRIDSAVRNQNMRTLAEIHKSARDKIREVSRELTEEDALALLDRDHVWQAFGLYEPGEGHLIDEWTSEEPGSRYKQQVGPMAHILSSMGVYQFGLGRGVEEREWPADLGGKPRRLRRNW